MNSIVIKAPAKINLFLKVLAKRPDGYHSIETLFEKIAIFDEVRLQKASKGISVSSNEKGLPKAEENLAYKAAKLVGDRYKIPLDLRIEIEKSIPIGAGLGGGSSDAAATLIGIDRLYNMGLSTGEFELLAKDLGADVPFFVSNNIWAVGRERGDAIEGIDIRLKLWHILIIPSFSILSKDAYEWADKKTLKKAGPDINKTLFPIEKNDIKALGKNLYNDLEGISLEKTSLLKGLKSKLIGYGTRGAMISGSGPALFGIVERKEEVMRLKEKIKKEMTKEDWQILIASTLYDERGGK